MESVSARSRRSRIFKNRSTFLSCVIVAARQLIWRFSTASGHYFKRNSRWRRRETTNIRAWFSSIKHSVAAGSKPDDFPSSDWRSVPSDNAYPVVAVWRDRQANNLDKKCRGWRYSQIKAVSLFRARRPTHNSPDRSTWITGSCPYRGTGRKYIRPRVLF